MRRWHGRGALAIAWGALGSCKPFVVLRQARLASTAYSKDENAVYDRYAVFQRTPVPRNHSIEEWAALLDGALPPHLRDQKISPPLLTLSAVDLAEILLAAQRGKPEGRGHDLLYHLGFGQGRWSAVVWLIKKLVDRFPIPKHPDASITDYLKLWNQVHIFKTPLTVKLLSKEEEHGYPLHLELDPARYGPNTLASKSLDEITGSSGFGEDSHKNLAHDALGQIWYTLGAMTTACAGGSIRQEVRQEVLEIIAYLHHREIMPMSIYQYQPRMDKSAIQQPPLIPLLSSRIFTSLSDAAWRAQEKLMADEAKARHGDLDPKQRPAFAAPYRARVDSLFPEVWLELILWSCLHGGWVKEGGGILYSVSQNEHWKPLSWREYEKALPVDGQPSGSDWDAWGYFFKTRPSKSMDPSDKPIPEVQRTVSAEVVIAYIDAIASLPPDDDSSRSPPFHPLLKLQQLASFLREQDLGLTTGLWDALVIRLFERHLSLAPRDISLGDPSRIVELSPGLGQGLTSKNTQDLPAYVLDGGLAMQGILNQELHMSILAGNLGSALRVLSEMLARTDRDKQTSLASFMEGSKSLFAALDGNDIFTSNVTGIEYPAFDLQIPPLTLGLLLELLIQHNEYEIGHWLLFSKDADGPIIKRDLYDDPLLTPALVRFAIARRDRNLFKILRASPNFDFRLVLDAQVDAMRWDVARAIVTRIHPDRRQTSSNVLWTMSNLANLARMMLSLVPGATAGEADSRQNLQSAKKLFSIMVHQIAMGKTDHAVRVQTLLTVLSALDTHWADFCQDLRRLHGHHDFLLMPEQFNSVLQGVVLAYGSAAGIRLLDVFWPQSARVMERNSAALSNETRPRTVVILPGNHPKAVFYRALRPTFTTVTILLQKILEELRDVDRGVQECIHGGGEVGRLEVETAERTPHTPREAVVWAARRMMELPDAPCGSGDVVYHIDRVIQVVGMEGLRRGLSGIVRDAGRRSWSDPRFDGGGGGGVGGTGDKGRVDDVFPWVTPQCGI